MKTTMNNPINNSVFDTRDLIDYKNELAESLTDIWNDMADEDHQASDINEVLGTDGYEYADDVKDLFANFEEVNDSEIEEYNNIVAFCDELESNSTDYTYGESVIHADYFTEYTQDTLEDCGYLPKDLPSWIVIDMDATAENVKVDYAEVSYDGETYYIRSV